MHDAFREQLSAYADGELPPAERQAIERHLVECAECTRALEEIRAVTGWAPNFQGLPTSRDLWPAIESRLAPPGTLVARRRRPAWLGRRIAIPVPLLIAAGVGLLLVTAGAMWLARSSGPPAAPFATGEPAQPRAWNVSIASMTELQYDKAVAELEQILASNDTALDPGTLQVIRESLATIDQAIRDARAAIAGDSTNDFLNASIAHNMRRKLDILRTATQAAVAKS